MKNGKKKALLILCALLICTLTGCMMVQTEFEFKPDGGFSVSDGVYYSKEFFDLIQQTPEEFLSSEEMEEKGIDPQKIASTEANGTTYYGYKNGMSFDSLKAFENYYDSDELPWHANEYKDEDGRRVASISYTIMSNEQALEELGVDPSEQEQADSQGSNLVYVSLKCTFPGGVKNVIGMSQDGYTVSGNSVEMKIESSDMEWTVIIEGYLDEAAAKKAPVKKVEVEFPVPKLGEELFEAEKGSYYTTDPKDSAACGGVEWYRLKDGSDESGWEKISADVHAEKGFSYGVIYKLITRDDYLFDELTEVVFNGVSTFDSDILSSLKENEITVRYIFGKAEGAEEPVAVGDKKYTPFIDVPKDAYYYDATVWAYTAEPQITDGNGKDKFMPEQICNRGQVVTFLWRAAGCPEPKSSKNPFIDVKSDDYFYKAVLWAVENKITDGTDTTHFSPTNPCRNSHILTFIYRAMGEPKKTANPATWYTDAYNWAQKIGLLNGTYAGTFDINAECPRKNVVQYLYKYYTMQ